MPTAFVAGATGYTGRALVRALIARGVTTIAHVRPDSPSLSTWQTRFRDQAAEVDTTPWRPEAMAEALARHAPTHVFAVLGTTRKRRRQAARSGEDASYERIDYGLTKLLLDAASALVPRHEVLDPKPCFVYLSAAGVSAGARGAYMRARWQTESALRASGLPYIIARPSFVTGPDRDELRPGERLGAAAGDGVLALAGLFGARTLRDRYRSTSATELAQALVRHALDPASQNRIITSEALRAEP